MAKVNLLTLSDIIFDYCPQCGGFFLDKAEVGAMNRFLRELSHARTGEEFRAYRNERLVALTEVKGQFGKLNFATLGYPITSSRVSYIQIAVHFKTPLNVALRISMERWTTKLAKLFGLFGGQDIQTGNDEFDSAFLVQGDDEATVKSLLTPAVEEALLRFASRKSGVFAKAGTLEVLQDRIVYKEGPYEGDVKIDAEKDAGAIMDELASLAMALEDE